MNDQKNKSRLYAVVAVVVVLALAVGIALGLHKNKASAPSTNTTTSAPTTDKNITTNGDSSASSGSVKISNFAFSLSQISVKVGSTVTWTNDDSVAHTVTADQASSDAPNSPTIDPGKTYSFTFNKAGSYQYHCTFHSAMHGTIVVTQ